MCLRVQVRQPVLGAANVLRAFQANGDILRTLVAYMERLMCQSMPEPFWSLGMPRAQGSPMPPAFRVGTQLR